MGLSWSRERYVRTFTRDTPSWLLAPWEARAFLLHLLRKLDRNGRIDLGDDGWEGLAATVMMPVEVVEGAVGHWLKRRTLVLEGSVLTMPNFVEAQECVASEALRAQQYRERKKVEPVTKRDEPSQNVTEHHAALRSVTRRHEPSRGVTERHSVPSVPSVPDLKKTNAGEGTGLAPEPAPFAPIPPSPIGPDIIGQCQIAGYPAPLEQDWIDCVLWYRSEGKPLVDSAATLFRWMGGKKRLEASAKARASPSRRGGPVQPAVPMRNVTPKEATDEECERLGF